MATIDLRSSIRNTLTVDDPEQVFVDAMLGCLLMVVITRPRGLPSGADDVTCRSFKVTEQPARLPSEWFQQNDYLMVERTHTPAADEPYLETGHQPPLPAQQGIGDAIARARRS